jgi:transcriptional regulator with XRE-family HTH domain
VKEPAHSEGAQFVKELPERFNELGSFIREQRSSARLSLRRLSELAGISNPYLSQIERGLRRPSAEILQQIARGLRISAETLYVQAGILDERAKTADLAEAIMADPFLGDEQKQTLLHIYRSFRQANDESGPPATPIGVASSRRAAAGSRSRQAGARPSGSPDPRPSGSPDPEDVAPASLPAPG